LRSLGIPSRNDRRNWRSCSWKTSPHVIERSEMLRVGPATFLDLGAVCLNELTEIVDVRPVREENVCCDSGAATRPRKAVSGGRFVVERRVRIPTTLRSGFAWPLVWGSLVSCHFEGLLSICSKSSMTILPTLSTSGPAEASGGNHFLSS
jgi:hypothetical protein